MTIYNVLYMTYAISGVFGALLLDAWLEDMGYMMLFSIMALM